MTTAQEQWIRSAPTHWTRGRIKNLISFSRNGTWGSDPLEDGSDVHCVRGTDFNRTTHGVNLSTAPLRHVGPPFLQQHLLNHGDLILEKSGGGEKQPVGMAVLFTEAERAVCSNFCARIAPPADVDPRFLTYAFAAAYRLGITQAAIKQTTGIQNLDTGTFFASRWAYPEREEQSQIADFLDAEIAKVNGILARKRRLLALLNERVDSRILQHVGASQLVDPAAGLPALPLRRLLAKVVRPAAPDVGVITAYRDGQVTERGARRAEGYTLSASTDPQGQYVKVGDVVVHGLDGFAGAIGTAEAEGNCSPVYHVCLPERSGDARFLGRLLRILALQGYLGNFATSTRERAVDFRNWDLFGRIPIPVIPPDEQREIGQWIDRLRPLNEAIERSASLASERSQALITAAVTGQFDVSTASGRNVAEGVSA
ncbi:hypothetical protein [Streptomyces sp. JNUCC 63]